MTIAKMVREMIAKGVDPEVIELAVATAEEVLSDRVSGGIPVDTAAEKRRAYDRARKRNLRGIPPDSTGHPRNSENASLSKEEKKEENKEEREAPKRNVRGQRLADDWQPTAQDLVTAQALIGEQRVRDELEKFRDHWKQQSGSRAVKADWNAAWRNWVRRAAEYGGNRNGHSHRGTNGHRPANNAFFAGIASVAADIDGHGQAPGPASPEVPLGRINIDG